MEHMERQYFEFIYERQLVWYKRFVLKLDPPWTNDKILQKFKFINMYRELDKCTIYILKKLKSVDDREKLLINIIFFRFFNKNNLYEELNIKPFKSVEKRKLIDALEKRKSKGLVIFNDAYLISSSGYTGKKHEAIIDNLSKIDAGSIVNKLDKASTPEESFEIIMEIPLVGPFLACEIWTDLTYFKFFKQNWNDNDFVNIGPGAKWGLEIIYGKLNKKELKEKLNELYKKQFYALKNMDKNPSWKKIAFKDAYSNYPYLSITNIEGALCEFRKYHNIKSGKGKRRIYDKTI